MGGHLNDSELDYLLDDLTDGSNIRPGIHLIAAGFRSLADEVAAGQLDIPATQLLLAQLAGSVDGIDVVAATAELIIELTSPDTNPALGQIPLDKQKEVTHQGFLASFGLTDPDLRRSAAIANAALDQ